MSYGKKVHSGYNIVLWKELWEYKSLLIVIGLICVKRNTSFLLFFSVCFVCVCVCVCVSIIRMWLYYI